MEELQRRCAVTRSCDAIHSFVSRGIYGEPTYLAAMILTKTLCTWTQNPIQHNERKHGAGEGVDHCEIEQEVIAFQAFTCPEGFAMNSGEEFR